MKRIFIPLFLFLTLVLTVWAVADNYTAGTSAGGNITTGQDNYISGNRAGMYLTTGDGNTLLGEYAGHQLTTGKGNILLGYMGGYSLTTSNYKLYITNGFYPAKGIFGDLSTGYFGINNTSPATALDVTGALTISGAFGLTGILTTVDDIIAKGDTTVFTAEPIVTNATEADTSAVKIVYRSGSTGDPFIALWDSIGGTGYLEFTSDILKLTGSVFNPTSGITTPSIATATSGTYLSIPDSVDISGALTITGTIDGSDIVNTTIGAGGASTGSFTTLTASGLSSLGAVNSKSTVQTITTDSTLTAAMAGDIICNTGAAYGKRFTLPACAAGLPFTFVESDADSLMIVCASGDSIFNLNTLKPNMEAHAINSVVKIIGVPTAGGQFNWFLAGTPIGTWTGY